jgi:signal peptidase I
MKYDPERLLAERKLSRNQFIRREIFAWMWVALAYMLLNGTVGQARMVPTGSMENTILIGDHLLMSRIGYDVGIPFTGVHVPLWRNPKRQQMIVFRPVTERDDPDLVKRVIGLPGDLLDIRDGAVWINGQELVESYVTGPTEALGMQTPYQVPDGCYFVMGDNRGNSFDSRFTGCVPRKNIIGTPVLIYMSVAAPSEKWEDGVVGRLSAYGNALLHPSLIRWRRLFHPL